LIVRSARQTDLPQLVEIFNQSVSAHRTAVLEAVTLEERQSWFDAHDSKTHPILVVEAEKQVLGYLYLSAYRPGRSALKFTAEVSYFVDVDHHRRGLASLLMETCLEKCPGLGIKTVFAIVLETNTSSINLLKKHGFQQWALLPGVAEIDGVDVGQAYYGRKV
jgi:L-amino acid N-acyltransferase YncA